MNLKQPIKTINVYYFLTDEFLKCDEVTFRKIGNLYLELYGQNAYKYMVKTYPLWKVRAVGISGQTFRRILECVPKFLSDEKRFYILKAEVLYFVEKEHFNLNNSNKNKTGTLSEVNQYFQSYESIIDKFNNHNLAWFYGNGIFSENELWEFLQVCKYSIQKRLSLSYEQVTNDLDLLRSNLNKYQIREFKGDYSIDFLSKKMDVSDVNKILVEPLNFTSFELTLNGRLKKFAEKYIIDELLKLDFTTKEGSANGLIKSNDIDLLFNQYNDLRKGKQDVAIKSTFQGEGGVLTISLDFVPNQKLTTQIVNKSAILFLLISAFGLFTYFSFKYKLGWAGFPLLIMFFFLLSTTKTSIDQILSNLKQLKKNGK